MHRTEDFIVLVLYYFDRYALRNGHKMIKISHVNNTLKGDLLHFSLFCHKYNVTVLDVYMKHGQSFK